MYLRCTPWCFVCVCCKMVITIKLVNIFITPYLPLFQWWEYLRFILSADFKYVMQLGIMVHVCNLRTLWGWGRNISSSRPAWSTHWELVSKTNKQKVYVSVLFSFLILLSYFFTLFILLYWRYIMTFTKVLIIYHSWIHPFHHCPMVLLTVVTMLAVC
jgi:hypothetical protein